MAAAGQWHIGVFGGSGLYKLDGLEDVQEIKVKSPFGDPSGPVVTGTLEGVRFTFMARHGAGHRLSPSAVNYRANIDVMKRCGVTDILAISAVGSLREEFEPGQFVAVDQFIDRTLGRARTYFDEGLVAHVSLADPVCPMLSGHAADAVDAAGGAVHRGGCYVAIEGPQFSTRAESHRYRGWGADVIGMTAMPEARLAREAELPYGLLAMVTDYDCWREEIEAVDVSSVLAVVSANAALARDTVMQFAKALPASRPENPIDRALDFAVVSDIAALPAERRAKLSTVAGRIL